MNMKTMQRAVLVLALAVSLCACAAQPQPLASMHTLTGAGSAESSGRGGGDCEEMFGRQPFGVELRLSAGGVQLPILPIFW